MNANNVAPSCDRKAMTAVCFAPMEHTSAHPNSDQAPMNETMWKHETNRLILEVDFQDFAAAFAFLTEVARLAEEQGHHPTIQNTYNRVKLELTTHDAGNTLTDKDHRLAASIQNLLAFQNS